MAAPQSSNQDALKWLVSRAQWLDRSSDTCFGLAPVYVLCLDERIAHVRQFLENNGIEGRVSIVRAFTPEEVDLQEFIDRGIVDAEFIKGRDRKKRVLELCVSLGHLAIALDSQLTGPNASTSSCRFWSLGPVIETIDVHTEETGDKTFPMKRRDLLRKSLGEADAGDYYRLRHEVWWSVNWFEHHGAADPSELYVQRTLCDKGAKSWP